MRALRVGICLLVAFAVAAHGVVEPWSEAILELGAAVLLIVWGIVGTRGGELEIRWNWLYLPLLALLGFGLAQCVFGLSFYTYATEIELLRWGAIALLGFLAVAAFRSAGDMKSFVWFLLSLGFCVALFGIIQYFTFNGKLYWFRVLRQGGLPFGPFVNRNHFAGFIELIVPMGLAVLFHGAVRRDKLPLLALFVVFPIGALVLSASRGGIFSFLFELLLLALLVRTRRGGRSQLLVATGLALLVAVLVAWLGIGQTVQRFKMSGPQELSQDRRVAMLEDTAQIFRQHPWTGTGLGTLETVYPGYETYYDGLVVSHTHNDYLELLADAGVVGGACGLAFLVLLFWFGLSNLHQAGSRVSRSFHAGALVGCVGLLLHGLVDFNFHIPSNALLFLLLALLATSSIQEPLPDRYGPFRF
jgi:O-antigen ligase